MKTTVSDRVAGRVREGAATDTVRAGLEEAATELRAAGVPVPPLAGKLLRPLVAWALVPAPLRERLDGRFWAGALAVQMVHEASLLHDDILDDATERRGRRSAVADRGVGWALVQGDHYLTGAYRAATATRSHAFLEIFIEAVERTVAGEIRQGRSAGQRLDQRVYRDVVTGKSGELFGAAAALGDVLLGFGRVSERIALGRDLGALYQRVDDLLDYCPAADTGKVALKDFRQGKWTWVLDLADLDGFDVDEESLVDAIFRPRGDRPSAARRALEALAADRNDLVLRAAELGGEGALAAEVMDGWVRAAERGVAAQERALEGPSPGSAITSRPPAAGLEASRSPHAEVAAAARELGPPAAWERYFARHARTFRFAARLFPRDAARRITGVYAFCRFTDDLVDEPWDGSGPEVLAGRLAAWRDLAREAFEGGTTGVPLLDEVLGEAGRRGVAWRYPEALLEGVGMDLTVTDYDDWPQLRRYTFGVAASVGGWITGLLGAAEPDLLDRAHALGHAMQLTNIVRDVGEDLDRGRLYVPRTLLEEYGLGRDDLVALRRGSEPVPAAWAALVEELMARADADYRLAWPGIRRLPGWFRRPVAVAAGAYRAIHHVVRRNGYDNLRLRATTSLGMKAVHGLGSLYGPGPSMTAPRDWRRRPSPAASGPGPTGDAPWVTKP